MIKSYLVTGFRNIARQKLYSAINLAGLAITLTVSIFIFMFVRNEFTYDTSFQNYQNVFRVLGNSYGRTWGRANIPWGEAAKEIPQIESYTRIWEERGIVRRGRAAFKETVSFADSGFFDVFPFPMRFGDPSTALTGINSAVLSETLAKKLFGSENPVGKEIKVQVGGTLRDFNISGVTATQPGNSSIVFSILIPYFNVKYTMFGGFLLHYGGAWGVSNVAPSAFVRLRSTTEKTAATNLLNTMMSGYLSAEAGKVSFALEPIDKIHFDTSVAFNMQKSSDPRYAFILIGLAALILLTACINFINLTISRSTHRFKEVGIRKVMGGSRRDLFFQLMTEATVLSFGALLIALVSVELFLPGFERMTGKSLASPLGWNWIVLSGLVILTAAVALVSGGYPAAYLSRLGTTEVLKGGKKLSSRKGVTRSMIVFQFVVSAGLLISAAVMYRQLNYIQTKNLGFDKENVVVINDPFVNDASGYQGWYDDAQTKTFMERISGYTGIEGVTSSSEMLGRKLAFQTAAVFRTDTVRSSVFAVGSGYIRTMGMKLLEGRDFSQAMSSDSTDNVIVNETLVRQLRIKRPLGRIIRCPYPGLSKSGVKIVGVVKDFNFESLAARVSPCILAFRPSTGWNYVIVRIRPRDVFSTMSFLKTEWEKVLPGMPFNYSFLDDYLDSLYSGAERWDSIIGYSAAFAVLIALMGLFGLASYAVEKRSKEISIRRIMGAKSGDIAGLVYREFFIMVLASSVLACPAAWYIMREWLQDFAYRTALTAWPFVGTCVLILLLTFGITIFHVLRAGTMNPIESLRYE